jgi:hypothetical protein
MYQGAFAKKKSGPRTPPHRCPPGTGFLSAERGRAAWHAQLAPPVAPATHQPAPSGGIQGNVSRQLAGAVVLGGGAAPAPPLAGSGRFCASSIRVAKKNARCPLAREAWPGWLSYAHCSREGQEEEQSTSSVVSPRGSCPLMNTEPLGQRFIFHGTMA